MKKNKIRFWTLLGLLVATNTFAQAQKWTLEQCVTYALENNLSIKQSQKDQQLADIAKKDAIGNFLPNANASASHSWNIGLNPNITTGLLQNQTTQFTSAGFNVGVTIYDGLKNQLQLQKARLNQIASNYQLDKMKEDISLNVVNAFLQIVFNQENLNVQQQQLDYNKKQLTRTEALVNAGTIAKAEWYDAKANVAADAQRLVVAQNNLLLSKLSLAQLLQLQEPDKFDVDVKGIALASSKIVEQSVWQIISKAKENRVDLKLAENSVALAEKDVKLAKAAYQPTVSGFYGMNSRVAYTDRIIGLGAGNQPVYGGPAPFFDQLNTNKGQSFGVSINVPIFNGFAVRNNVKRSKIALDKANMALQQRDLEVTRTVYTAFTDTQAAQKTLEASQTTLEARQLAFSFAKDRFEAGMMTVFDFNQAQTLYNQAQSDVLRAKYDLVFRTKILEYYFGLPIIQN